MKTENSLTLTEFKSWLTGLIQGKKGEIPDVDDWREIKNKLDNVVPDEKVVYAEKATSTPVEPGWEWNPSTLPYATGDFITWHEGQYVSDNTNTGGPITTTENVDPQLDFEFPDSDVESLVVTLLKNQMAQLKKNFDMAENTDNGKKKSS